MTEVEFGGEIKAINEQWRKNYEAARSRATAATYSLEGSEEDGQLLMQWLLAAQGLDSQQDSSSGLHRLLGELTFETNQAAPQAYLNFQLQRLQEITFYEGQERERIAVTLATPDEDTMQPGDKPVGITEPEATRDESQLREYDGVADLQGEAAVS